MEIRPVGADVSLDGATLIAGVMQGLEPAPGSESALERGDGSQLSVSGFEGKTGQTITLKHEDAEALLLVGLGEELTFESLRNAAGNAIRKVKTERVVTLLGNVGLEGATRAVTEGTVLGAYQFRDYKTDEESLDAQTVDVVDAEESEMQKALVVARATAFARDLVNTPAMDKGPKRLAARVEEEASDANVDVDVWSRKKIKEERLGALLGVAAGSDRAPRLVVIEYRPDSPVAHLALVGKGIVFDTGGLSLKSAAFMEEMKDDMSGAAVVSAATIAIARLGIPVSVTCVTPLTDNAVGGNATRPGDVLRPIDGPTIEVLNTDAEGRLVLADGLGLAKAYEPDLTIDVATLTGAARVALGDKIAAVFGSDSEVAATVLEAASRAGEEFWEMPLFKGYRKNLDSDIADVKNVASTRYGGAIHAALFLAEYAGEGRWAHLDIAGPARARETAGDQVKGASGVGVRTLVEVARGLAESG